MTVTRKYYTINEQAARFANDANSMRDYKEGGATATYKDYVDEVYDIVDKIAEKKPDLFERAENMANRYSRKLADYYNAYYRNEASCPSVLISGAGNFPTKKKAKQNDRRDTLMNEWVYLTEYAEKIKHLLTMEQPILSKDANAIQKLEEKLESLKELQENMKAANAYFRKNGTVEGCPVMTEAEIKYVMEIWERYGKSQPYATYALTNNNQKIHATEDRLNELKANKDRGTIEKEYNGFTVRENTDIMRLQILFDGKPEENVRDVLKSNGFRWSYKEGAWQRQLTNNARYAFKHYVKDTLVEAYA